MKNILLLSFISTIIMSSLTACSKEVTQEPPMAKKEDYPSLVIRVKTTSPLINPTVTSSTPTTAAPTTSVRPPSKAAGAPDTTPTEASTMVNKNQN